MIQKSKNKRIIYTVSLSSGLAGHPAFLARYKQGVKQLEELGFDVVASSNSLKGLDYISNNPEKRVDDLIESFTNPNTFLVLSNIGGNDSYKIWDFLKNKDIKKISKPFLGFSDSTSVHLILYKMGIKSYYGMSNLTTFAENNGILEFSKNWFTDYFLEEKTEIPILSSKYWTSELLKWEDASTHYTSRKLNKEEHGLIFSDSALILEEKILGGCLESLFYNIDYDFFPSPQEWENKIVFLETSEQKPSPLEFSKMLEKLWPFISLSKAIVFGKPKDETYFFEYLDIIKKLKIPYVYNLNFGHTDPVLIFGYKDKLRINFIKKEITLCLKK